METETLLIPLKQILSSYHVGLSWNRLQVDSDHSEAQSVRIIMNADLAGEKLCISSEVGKPLLIKRSQRIKALQPNDVVATLKFIEFAAATFSPKDTLLYYATSNAAVLSPKLDLVMPTYLVLWLQSRDGQEQIDQIRTMTTKTGKPLGRNFSSMTLTNLLKIVIPVPSIEHQTQMVQKHEAILIEKEQYLQQYRSQVETINSTFEKLRLNGKPSLLKQRFRYTFSAPRPDSKESEIIDSDVCEAETWNQAYDYAVKLASSYNHHVNITVSDEAVGS